MLMRLLASLLGVALLTACQARPQPRLQTAPAPAAPLEVPALPRAPVPLPAALGPSGVFGRFLDAVRESDAAVAWELLSKESRAELGNSADEFAARAFAGLKVRYGLWEGYRVALDDLVSPNLAVVSITGRRTSQEIDAVAAALVLEQGAWRLAVHGSLPVEPEEIGPNQIVLRAPSVRVNRAWLGSQPAGATRKGDRVVVAVPLALTPAATVLTVLTASPQGIPGAQAFPIPRP